MNEQELARILANPSVSDVPPLVDAIRQFMRARDYWRMQAIAFERSAQRLASLAVESQYGSPDLAKMAHSAVNGFGEIIAAPPANVRNDTYQLPFPAQLPMSPADASAPQDAQRAEQPVQPPPEASQSTP